MSRLLETSVALTRAWCNAYTRGLPGDERAARRAEIDSDLWEHGHDGRVNGRSSADVGYDILVRFITGVPADIVWRRSIRLSRRASAPAFAPVLMKGRKMATRLFVLLSAALAIVLGAFLLFNAVGLFIEGDENLIFGISQAISGAALIASVPVGARSPRKSAALVAAAVIVYAVVHFWMAVIVVPLGLILFGGAWLRSRSAPPPVPQA